MTLGKLIRLLEMEKQDNEVRFDFGYFRPRGLESYRGSYDHLALSYTEDHAHFTVADLLALLKGAIGKTFQGWKGGDYVMGEYTPIWVANSGESPSTAVEGIADCDYLTIIATRWHEGLF